MTTAVRHLLAALVILCAFVPCQSARGEDERIARVHSAVLETILRDGPIPVFVVATSLKRSRYDSRSVLEKLSARLPALGQDTVESFASANASPTRISQESLGAEVRWTETGEAEDRSGKSRTVAVSLPGFSRDGTQALVRYECYQYLESRLVGWHSGFFLLTLESGLWKVKSYVMSAIS